ncbi:hypothetical protein ACCC84_21530 [Serratia odorifera]|jgi:hypothetical protein|uniref:hypothetical protein n=1 Tax=Serratia odorifera TaxID=618 RepID=UPI003531D63B
MWNRTAHLGGALLSCACFTSMYGSVFFRWYLTNTDGLLPAESSVFLILFTLSWVCLSLAAGLVLSAFVIGVFNSLGLALSHGGRAGQILLQQLRSSRRNKP